jgi:HAD superfamily hydrolase (TIGR01549 family)
MTVNLENIKAILFDLDGTLIDTDNVAVEKLAGIMRPLFGDRAGNFSRQFMMKMETPGNLLIRALDALSIDELAAGLTDWLRRRRGISSASDFQLIAGVEETVSTLKERYALAIVTTRSRYQITQFLTQFPSMDAAFEVTCGLQDTRRLKPHPDPVLLAAERLDVPYEDCLMVGDTTVDIRAAIEAGAMAAGVLCGFGTREELEKAGAHLILESTSELLEIL